MWALNTNTTSKKVEQKHELKRCRSLRLSSLKDVSKYVQHRLVQKLSYIVNPH